MVRLICTISLCRDGDQYISNWSLFDNYLILRFKAHILHSGRPSVPTHAVAHWAWANLRARMDANHIVSLFETTTTMNNTYSGVLQDRNVQCKTAATKGFPWRTFNHFYRPWRLAATSHRDVVLLPDIAQQHPPVVPPSHVGARTRATNTTHHQSPGPHSQRA